jgi:hypothetical protein
VRAYIDSDILIWHLRGHAKALTFLRGLRDRKDIELWVGALQRAEVVFFMRPDEERHTLLLLSCFKTAAVDQTIVDAAAALYRQWNPIHGIDVNDALLAATALRTGGIIYGLNRKHYPMPEVRMERAW